MQFTATAMVTKISVSDMLRSQEFYTKMLGFSTEDKYTINKGHSFSDESYMQLTMGGRKSLTLGLYKDIDSPFQPLPQIGTVPSFIVPDIYRALDYLQENGVVIDKAGDGYIISNTSDKGYTDLFFFFRDPDNNSLVARQNLVTIINASGSVSPK